MSKQIAVSLAAESDRKTERYTEGTTGFGQVFTDHMFLMDYREGQGWVEPRIVPYGPLSLDPASKVFHYGQTVFEGMKAFRLAPDQRRVGLFRPAKHLARLNRSCERLSVPPVDEQLMLEAIRKLVEVDRDWIPSEAGTSLYIRPFVIATEPLLGVAPSREYKLIVILSPSGAYYDEGLNPVSLYVETHYVRASAGGVGEAKTAGNYAASLKAQQEAAVKGYTQVLWLDAIHRRYVEEVGSMNVFFRFGDTVVTPSLGGTILAGVTRDSVLRLLQRWGIKTEERPVAIEEVVSGLASGELKEIFGTGTAAVISPVGELYEGGARHVVADGHTGELTQRLYDTLVGIQRGEAEDEEGWMDVLEDSSIG